MVPVPKFSELLQSAWLLITPLSMTSRIPMYPPPPSGPGKGPKLGIGGKSDNGLIEKFLYTAVTTLLGGVFKWEVVANPRNTEDGISIQVMDGFCQGQCAPPLSCAHQE